MIREIRERVIEGASRWTLNRVDRRVGERGKDHLTAYPLLASLAIGLVAGQKGERDVVYDGLRQRIVRSLGARGIGVQIYALSGDLGSGYTESRDYLRVIERNGRLLDTSIVVNAAYDGKPVLRAESKKVFEDSKE